MGATSKRFAAALLTTLLVVGVFTLANAGGDSSSVRSSAADTTPSSGEGAAEDEVSTESLGRVAPADGAAQAEAVVTGVVRATEAVMASGGDAPDLLADQVSPSILNELESAAYDLRRSGLHQTGSAQISWLKASDPQVDDNGQTTVSVLACVDMSDVAFVTEAGEPSGVVNGLSNPNVLQQYTLAHDPSGWVVTHLDFPNENTC